MRLSLGTHVPRSCNTKLAAQPERSSRPRYITFLRTHHLAYRAVLPAVPQGHWVAALLRGVLRMLDADLKKLGVAGVSQPMIGLLTPMHPLGAAYVICGTHFGRALLRRRWAQATDQAVLAADAYLRDDSLSDGWVRLMAELETLRDPIRDLEVLGSDADRTFAIFQDCLINVKHWEHTDAVA